MAARYSKQPGSKSRQNPCQVQPTKNMETYRRQDDVFGHELQFLLSSLECCQYLNYKLCTTEKTVCMCCPTNEVFKSDAKRFLALGRLHEDKLCDILQAYGTDQCRNASSNVLIPYREQLRLTRIVVAHPRPAFSATRRSRQITLQSVLINRAKFLKVTHHTEIRKIETPRSMVVEALDW